MRLVVDVEPDYDSGFIKGLLRKDMVNEATSTLIHTLGQFGQSGARVRFAALGRLSSPEDPPLETHKASVTY
jgi:hypothetical protein